MLKMVGFLDCTSYTNLRHAIRDEFQFGDVAISVQVRPDRSTVTDGFRCRFLHALTSERARTEHCSR